MFDEELDKYDTYEEYLDSLVSEEDHKYLQDEEMARAIAELGYRYVIVHILFYLVLTVTSSSNIPNFSKAEYSEPSVHYS